MEPFFTDKKAWEGGGPYLHVLILLGEYPEARAYAAAHRDVLADWPLSTVGEDWLHITVQGVHHPTTPEQKDLLRASLREKMREVPSFSVELGPVWPGVTAVTAAVYPENGMDRLYRQVRAACDEVPGISLRKAEKRFWPHWTLAYTLESFNGDVLNRKLRGVRPARPGITVSAVHLVEQRQDRRAGRYTWTSAEEFKLG